MTVTIVVPAYNEEEALPSLLESIARVRHSELPDLRVLVVDDGSRDATPAVVRAVANRWSWIRIESHERNKGLSQAIQTGFHALLPDAAPEDVIVTMDADNTQPPETIPVMVRRIMQGADLIVASRFQAGAEVHGVPVLRRIYSRTLSLLFQIAFPVHGVRDYSCGFRAYRAGLLQRAYATYGEQFITEQGFACMVEILLQLNRLKDVQFGEVPFVLHYDLKPTRTKMRVGKTIRDTLRVALKYRFHRSL